MAYVRFEELQTAQTQNLFALTMGGNTLGVGALVSSGTLTLVGGNSITLSQNGNAITISGAGFPIESISAASTLTSIEDTVLVDATAGVITVTLPAAASAIGHVYNIKKIDASFNQVIISPNGADKIDNGPNMTLNSQYQSRTIKSDGVNWWII